MLAVSIYARAMFADKLRCDPVTYACFAKKELSVPKEETPNAGYACRHLFAAKGNSSSRLKQEQPFSGA